MFDILPNPVTPRVFLIFTIRENHYLISVLLTLTDFVTFLKILC